MINKVTASQCYACDACITVCPVGAISRQNQVLDFFYPQIDNTKCIGCGRCEEVCPSLSATVYQTAQKTHKAFIAWNKDTSKRSISTSGGVFIALAEKTISEGGCVCGAAFTQDFKVQHIVSSKMDDVHRMMGAKYVQSDMTGIYSQIKTLLEKDIPVLFSGCPCQVAALHTYLGKKYRSLFCAEVVCHGISSPYLWEQYLRLREELHHGKIRRLTFRSKKNGWHESAVYMEFDNGAEYLEPYYRDAYSGSMVKNITLKESCYQCKFKGFASGADITLGDFWGANVEVPELDDDRGLSAVITHHDDAEKLFAELELNIQPCELQRFVKYNKSIMTSAPKPTVREVFYDAAECIGYQNAIKKHLMESRKDRTLRVLKDRVRKVKHLCTSLIKGK